MSPTASHPSSGHRRPTPPPITTGGPWTWDATKAVIDTQFDVSLFPSYAGPLGYLVAEVAYGVVNSHSSGVYTVSSAGKNGKMDPTIWVPNGQQIGTSNDNHLLIEDRVTNRWHDFDLVTFSGGLLTGWNAGRSMDIGVTNMVPAGSNTGAVAALFPLHGGLIMLEEVQAGVIPHALVFTAANLGAAPNRYPSLAKVGYTSGNAPAGSSIAGHIPLGTWMRLDPNFTLPNTLGTLERVVLTALQQYGCFCRDRGSSFGFHCADNGGGGQSAAAWQALGATTMSANNGMAWKMSSTVGNILANHLQILKPPPVLGPTAP